MFAFFKAIDYVVKNRYILKHLFSCNYTQELSRYECFLMGNETLLDFLHCIFVARSTNSTYGGNSTKLHCTSFEAKIWFYNYNFRPDTMFHIVYACILDLEMKFENW